MSQRTREMLRAELRGLLEKGAARAAAQEIAEAFECGGRAGIIYVMSRLADRDLASFSEIAKTIPGFYMFTVGDEVEQLSEILTASYRAKRAQVDTLKKKLRKRIIHASHPRLRSGHLHVVG